MTYLIAPNHPLTLLSKSSKASIKCFYTMKLQINNLQSPTNQILLSMTKIWSKLTPWQEMKRFLSRLITILWHLRSRTSIILTMKVNSSEIETIPFCPTRKPFHPEIKTSIKIKCTCHCTLSSKKIRTQRITFLDSTNKTVSMMKICKMSLHSWEAMKTLCREISMCLGGKLKSKSSKSFS